MALTRDEFFDDDFDFDLGGLQSNVSDIGNKLFPVDALSNQELAELSALQSRAQRLSPIDIPEGPANNRIAGNVFSTNTAPVLNAVTQGLERVVNAARQRRMLSPTGEGKALAQGADEIRERAKQLEGKERQMLLEEADAVERAAEATSLASRLGTLTSKAERAAAQREQQNEFMQTLFPDLAGRVMDIRGNIAEEGVKNENRMTKLAAEYGFDVALEGVKQANLLNEMDKELENELAKIRAKGEGGTGADGEVTGQDINNLRQVMTPVLQSLKQKEAELNLLDIPEAERARRKAALQAQQDKILNTVFEKAAAATGLSREEINAMINMTDEQSDVPASSAVGAGTVLAPQEGVTEVNNWLNQ